MQKLIRGGFGNNNVDTCARVCHSPTGYGLSTTFGTSAGTQDFDSVEQADVVLVIGANPTDAPSGVRLAHEEAAAPGREADRRSIRAASTWCARRMSRPRYHLPLRPGTNVAVLTALAHVIVTEGLVNEAFVRERCDADEFQDWADFVAQPQQQPGGGGEDLRRAGRRPSAPRPGSTPPAAMPRSITASASPSTARARPR